MARGSNMRHAAICSASHRPCAIKARLGLLLGRSRKPRATRRRRCSNTRPSVLLRCDPDQESAAGDLKTTSGTADRGSRRRKRTMGPVAAHLASRLWWACPDVAAAGRHRRRTAAGDRTARCAAGLAAAAPSASVASFLLNSVSFPVQRQGTVLVAENFQWDVVPACSGSTSLRVLLTAAVVWCGIQPRLSWPRKLLCILGAIPLALRHGIRVAALRTWARSNCDLWRACCTT